MHKKFMAGGQKIRISGSRMIQFRFGEPLQPYIKASPFVYYICFLNITLNHTTDVIDFNLSHTPYLEIIYKKDFLTLASLLIVIYVHKHIPLFLSTIFHCIIIFLPFFIFFRSF